MIHVHQHPDESARSSRGCPWVAECEIGGTVYTARSRSGAPYALARILVEGGIPDAPMVVTSHGTRGEMRYRSVHTMAGYTIAESVTQPVQRVRWAPHPGSILRDAVSPYDAVKADPGTSAPPETEAA